MPSTSATSTAGAFATPENDQASPNWPCRRSARHATKDTQSAARPVSSAANSVKGQGYLHEIPDQLGLMRQYTKWAEPIDSPEEAPTLVSKAIWHATSGRPRPVALECALDTWAKRAEVTLPDKPLPLPPESIDDEAITAAAKILGAAERPIIVVGGGALDAGPEVIKLAEMLEVPVSSYRRGRGVIPSSHRLAVDMPVGHRLWKDADAVLAVGTRFFIQNGNWGIDDKLKVVRVDIDPDEPDRFRKPDVALIGDARIH